MRSLRFFLGSHHPAWLATSPVPLFVSDRRLRRYRRLPRAAQAWAADSGGFTELSMNGTWDHGPTPGQYIDRVRRYHHEVGMLAWVAPQDWMCEPFILARTGLTVARHQQLTVANYLRLRDLAADADLPANLVTPVVRGWQADDYLRCVDLYARNGVDLARVPLVGVGSVCRRQSTDDAGRILSSLHSVGVTRLHGFGFKVQGLQRFGALLTSADSLAWSYAARRQPPLPGYTTHINCADWPRYAYRWHQRHIAPLLTPRAAAWIQPSLFITMEGVAA